MLSAIHDWESWGLGFTEAPRPLRQFAKGLSHQTWLLETTGKPVILKQYSAHSAVSFLQNCAREAEFTALASRAGLGPKILGRGANYLLFEYLPLSHPRLPSFGERQFEVLGRDIAKLHSLHASIPKQSLNNYFVDYWEKLRVEPASDAIELSRWLFDRREQLSALIEHFERTSEQAVFSHFDLSPDNILCGDNRFYFIDWECARIHDPWIDIATVVTQFQAKSKSVDAFMSGYGMALDQERLDLAIAVVRYLELIWYALKGIPIHYMLDKSMQQLDGQLKSFNAATL